GFDQVEIGRILRLRDELPAGMRNLEQEQIVAMVQVEVVQDRIHPPLVRRDLLIHPTQEIDAVGVGPARIALGPTVARRFPHGTKDLALGSTSIIDLLPGALGGARRYSKRFLTRIARGGNRSHLSNG